MSGNDSRVSLKIGITGTTGLFGSGLQQVFSREHEVVPFTHARLDLTDKPSVLLALKDADLDLLIHPAGIPDIDLCELEPEKAWKVNVEATGNLVEAALRFGFGLAFISSDAVFDGLKGSPYTETDPTNPPTVYGKTKVAAEALVKTAPRHWIFRPPVLFGPGKTNFVKKGIDQIRAGKQYVVASDQIGSALYTVDAAHTILRVAQSAPSGVYHLSNSGVCSRYELACEAARIAGLDSAKVIGVPREQMKRAAPRLGYSVMDMAALKNTGIPLPRPWQNALAEYISNEYPGWF